MVMFCTFGAIQSFGVYQDYYTVRDPTHSTAWYCYYVQLALPPANIPGRHEYSFPSQLDWLSAGLPPLHPVPAVRKIIR